MKKSEMNLEAGERLATKFKQLEETDLKQSALAVMTAYMNGVMEERARWEDKQKTA